MVDTKQKNIAIGKRSLREAEEIAERQGRHQNEVLRQAIAEYIDEYKEDIGGRVYGEVPTDGLIFPQDRAKQLNFTKQWSEDDTVYAIEPGGKYFDYYQFGYNSKENCYVCNNYTRMSIDVLEKIYELLDEGMYL